MRGPPDDPKFTQYNPDRDEIWIGTKSNEDVVGYYNYPWYFDECRGWNGIDAVAGLSRTAPSPRRSFFQRILEKLR